MFGICFLTTLATVLYYKNPQMEYPDLVDFFPASHVWWHRRVSGNRCAINQLPNCAIPGPTKWLAVMVRNHPISRRFFNNKPNIRESLLVGLPRYGRFIVGITLESLLLVKVYSYISPYQDMEFGFCLNKIKGLGQAMASEGGKRWQDIAMTRHWNLGHPIFGQIHIRILHQKNLLVLP